MFTVCNFKEKENAVEVFCLSDDDSLIGNDWIKFVCDLKSRIYEKNKNFKGIIRVYNLKTEHANDRLAKTFGVSNAYMVNDDTDKGTYPETYRPVCDTDKNYNSELHPYLMGYNSYNYDTTMLALYLEDALSYKAVPITSYTKEAGNQTFEPVKASIMRKYNDELFSEKFKEAMASRVAYTHDGRKWIGPDYTLNTYKIRKNMIMSGRHIDVARLNEKQQKVGLKRLLGMLGYQILESDKLAQSKDIIETTSELFDLIAYNVSDCVNLKELFYHPTYFGQFTLKKGLLESYPELIYAKKADKYAPDKRPSRVRRDRLTIDSSSAQFSTKSLCPYGHLKDIETVSFNYPSEQKAKEEGIPRVNVLEESKKFFEKNFSQYPELMAKFDTIYRYYKSIEGKNFNDSNFYKSDYPKRKGKVHSLSELPKENTCMFYYNKDGSSSSCFVTFSTGGIHGAEYNKDLFEADCKAYEKELAKFKFVMDKYPDPTDLRKAKKVELPDGEEVSYTKFLKAGATLKKAQYKDIESKKPLLFREDNQGRWKINPKYVYSSAALTNHEDFTSYYPNMLRMMSAFYNKDLGYDRYAEIFDNKQKYGKLMKDPNITKEQREYYNILRNGTKLILNSASGAADANFESSIRVNNQIISMRIIGQLFSWRIGQAQTLEGARIISTNTDGLYSVLEKTLNNEILDRESKSIGVEIEPEPCYLISKDSNNRVEITPDFSKVISASGGTLSCRKGPNPSQSLAHPAIIDWALTEYLIKASSSPDMSLANHFNMDVGREIINRAKTTFEPVKFLNMFQNVIASSIGSMNYIFGTTDDKPNEPIIMQHYNRVFIMKPKTPGSLHLHAANGKKLTPATKAKRMRNNERMQQHDDTARMVLLANGVKIKDLGNEKEAVVKKVTNIDDEWYILIENRNLWELTDDERQFIIDNLDYDIYLKTLAEGFTRNWQNSIPSDIEPFIDNGCDVCLSDENNSVKFNITNIKTLRKVYKLLLQG